MNEMASSCHRASLHLVLFQNILLVSPFQFSDTANMSYCAVHKLAIGSTLILMQCDKGRFQATRNVECQLY